MVSKDKQKPVTDPDLFGAMKPGEKVFALLDAARKPEIAVKPYEFQAKWVSLYKGEPEEALFDVAPYLVCLGDREEKNEGLIQWVLDELWGNSCGVFIYSSAGIDALHTHFQQFLIVTDEEGKGLYFRFYDPRVLKIFLPTCKREELRTFFGPVASFMMEDGSPDKKSIFSLLEGELSTEKKDIPDMMSSI